MNSKQMCSDMLTFKLPSVKGFYVYSPYQVKLQENIVRYFNKLLESEGYMHYLFPSVGHIKDLQAEKDFFKLNNECFTIAENLYLRPTSEAIAYPLILKHQFKQFKFFQCRSVFRNQSKDCKKFTRSRQIAFFHEAHAIVPGENLETQFNTAVRLYKQLLRALQIPYTCEYRPEDDRFPGAQKTLAFDTLDGLQIASIHVLKSNFLNAFKASDKRVVCFGFSQRLQSCISKPPIAFHPYPCIIIDMTRGKLEATNFVSNNFTVLKYDYREMPFSKYVRLVEQFYNPILTVKIGQRELETKTVSVGDTVCGLDVLDSVLVAKFK